MVLERILQDLDPKSLPQAKSLTQELSYKHLSDMASASSSCKDLLERISSGSPQDLLSRAGTGSCKDLLGRNLAGLPQEPVHARIHNGTAAGPELETPAAQTLRKPAQSKGTWTSHKKHFTREFSGKMPRPRT